MVALVKTRLKGYEIGIGVDCVFSFVFELGSRYHRNWMTTGGTDIRE